MIRGIAYRGVDQYGDVQIGQETVVDLDLWTREKFVQGWGRLAVREAFSPVIAGLGYLEVAGISPQRQVAGHTLARSWWVEPRADNTHV